MHEVTFFQYQSHSVRSLTIDDEPWFVARDVCDCLELDNITWALDGLDEEDLTLELLKSGGQRREMKLVSEPGLYHLIFKSRTDGAKKFKRWVTHEVLPAIRKTGSYSLAEEQPADKVVDIRHFRSTPSPSGLDIRYTLDLTKIILKPRRTNLQILERITGLQVQDIIEESPDFMDGPVGSVRMFVQKRCRPVDEDHRVPLKDLYAVYVDWCNRTGFGKGMQATNKGLSSYLRDKGYLVRRIGGLFWVYGLAMRQEVAA